MEVQVFPDSCKQGTSKAGNTYYRQTMFVKLPNEPVPLRVIQFVDAPMQPGEYVLDLSASLEVNDDQLRIGRLALVPASQVAAAKPPPQAQRKAG